MVEKEENEISIVIYGLGGQGVVKASRILTLAFSFQNKYVISFPSFGTEREGSPVEAYCRISDEKIYSRNQISDADYAIVFDKKLLNIKKIIAKKIFLNDNSKECKKDIICFNASDLALKILNREIVNTAMVAFFCKETNLISYENLIKAIKDSFSAENFDKNLKIVNEIYNKK